MPGIFGFVSTRPRGDAAALARAMGALLSAHDSQRAAATCGPSWCLGATWTPAHGGDPAPAPTADGARWSVVTGELYPAGEAPLAAPASPRPAILDALAANDPGRLAGANGQFAGAVVDLAAGTVTLVCDRYGLHPLYWLHRDGLFAFASEAKALLAVPGTGRDLDPEGLAAFLLLGEHFSDTTLLAGVKVAPGGAWLRSAGEVPRVESWWRIRYDARFRRGEEVAAAEEAARLFHRSVARQTAGPSRIAVPLSGGLDSRICLAGVPAGRPDVTSFTWGDPGCLDRVFAKQTARVCGVRHHDLDYRYAALGDAAARGAWISDGLAGATDFHILPYVPDLAAEAEVVLNGFAGDVLLGGNFHWRAMRMLPAERWPQAAFAKRNDALPLGELAAIVHPGARAAAAELPATFAAAFRAHAQPDPLGTLDAFLLDSRIRRWTSFGTTLLRTRLVSRAPFYDNDFFDHVAAVPPAWRTDHRFYREMLLRGFPEVAAIGWQTTGVPASWPAGAFRPLGTVARRGLGVLERLTRGAIRSPFPVARLARAFRGPLAPRLRSDLFDGAGPHWEVVDRGAGERIWGELMAGHDGRAKLIGVLLTLRHFLAQAGGERGAPPLAESAVVVTQTAPPSAARVEGAR